MKEPPESALHTCHYMRQLYAEQDNAWHAFCGFRKYFLYILITTEILAPAELASNDQECTSRLSYIPSRYTARLFFRTDDVQLEVLRRTVLLPVRDIDERLIICEYT